MRPRLVLVPPPPFENSSVRNLPLKFSVIPVFQALPDPINAVRGNREQQLSWTLIPARYRCAGLFGAPRPQQHLDDAGRRLRPPTSLASPSFVSSSGQGQVRELRAVGARI